MCRLRVNEHHVHLGRACDRQNKIVLSKIGSKIGSEVQVKKVRPHIYCLVVAS